MRPFTSIGSITVNIPLTALDSGGDMLKIQEFISCFEDIEEANVHLRRGLDLKIKEDELVKCSNSLKMSIHRRVYLYNCGVHSNVADPLVQEANVLILDDKANLVAKGPNRPLEALCSEDLPSDFRLEGAIAEEMTDGITVLIYNYEDEWHVATEKSVDASNYIPGMQLSTFSYDYEVKGLFQRRYGDWPKPFDDVSSDLCFTFDYVSPHNRIVMPYTSPGMFLLSIVDVASGTEIEQHFVNKYANKWDYLRPNWNSLAGCNSLSKFLHNIRPLSKGVILRDTHGTKVKIPNPIYYAIKSAKNAGERISSAHIAKILCSCRDNTDISIIRSTFPEYSKHIELLETTKNLLWSELMILWNIAREYTKDPKKFAETVQHHPLNCLLFMFRDGAIFSLKESVEKLDPRKLAALARGKYEKEFDSYEKSLRITNCGG